MSDTIELNVVTLDNQEDYIVLDKIEHQNKTYVYLTNEKEILLRKRIKENDEVVLEELENLDEVKLAFSCTIRYSHTRITKGRLTPFGKSTRRGPQTQWCGTA